jgi:RND family efflux transporter MFP subunit
MIKKLFAAVREHWKASLAIAAVVVGGYYYMSSSSDQQTAPTTVTKTETVKRGDLRLSVSGSGQVEAVSQVDLTPVIAGDGIDVIEVRVKNNQEVKKGQIIAVLDTEDAVRAIESAELDLRDVKTRQQQTSDQYKGDTKSDMLNRRLQEIALRQSENNLDKAKEKLQDYYIKAPFDGVVTGLSVEAGDSVSRSTVLASVITRDMQVAVSLNEVDAAKVAEGNSVTLSFDALPELALSGKISRIDTIGTTTQNVVSYDAKIALDKQDASLKPGMSASAEIAVAERQSVLLIPNAALATANGKTSVKTVKGTREIVTGLTDDVSTEIVSGLSEGDQVLIETVASAAKSGSSSVFSSLFRAPGSGSGSRSK